MQVKQFNRDEKKQRRREIMRQTEAQWKYDHRPLRSVCVRLIKLHVKTENPDNVDKLLEFVLLQ